MNIPRIIIYEKEEEITIKGSPEGLRGLGEMLILKARLGQHLSATWTNFRDKRIALEIYYPPQPHSNIEEAMKK